MSTRRLSSLLPSSALGVYPDPLGANGACPGPVGMSIPAFLRLLNSELSTFNFEPVHSSLLPSDLKLNTDNCKLRKSNHSRTYAPFSRKSNHSHTYAKPWGWGVPFLMKRFLLTRLFSFPVLTIWITICIIILSARRHSPFRMERTPWGGHLKGTGAFHTEITEIGAQSSAEKNSPRRTANREIHPAEPAGWSRVGVPGAPGSVVHPSSFRL